MISWEGKRPYAGRRRTLSVRDIWNEHYPDPKDEPLTGRLGASLLPSKLGLVHTVDNHQRKIVDAGLGRGEVLHAAEHGKQRGAGRRAERRSGRVDKPLHSELFALGVAALQNSIRKAE